RCTWSRPVTAHFSGGVRRTRPMKNVPSGQVSGNVLIVLYFTSKRVPMLVSGIAIYLGYKLFVFGVTGQASLVINAHSVSGQLANAAPGLFFAIGGIAALIVAVWRGSSFSFARENPYEIWAMCLPQDRSRWPKS